MTWRERLGLPEKRQEPNGELKRYIDNWFQINGYAPVPALNFSLPSNKSEEPGGDLQSYADYLYKSNGVVFACMLVRLMLFSEARFQWRQRRSGRPGDLFGTDALEPLEEPWPNGTTGSLLTRMIQDADLAGNSFNVRRSSFVRRLRPDWVDFILGVEGDREATSADVDAEVLGYRYTPGGRGSGQEPEFFLAEEVAHWAPIPDPTGTFRGMSWLTPVVREVMADSSMRDHKLTFVDNAATPNMIVKFDTEVSRDDFNFFKDNYRAQYEGAINAGKTLFLGGGADATVVGANFEQMDFKQVQGAGETRIAAAAGVPPVIVGLSEGLQAATYSNYGQARRRFADGTMRPLWRSAAAALATIIDVPPNAELWYDDRDIPFLQEDVQDSANVQSTQAAAMRQLVDAGFEPASVVDAIVSGDFSRLSHTDLFSVQLQPPGTTAPEPTNGNGDTEDQDAAMRALALVVDDLARREETHE